VENGEQNAESGKQKAKCYETAEQRRAGDAAWQARLDLKGDLSDNEL
jgi:hypothetical protein